MCAIGVQVSANHLKQYKIVSEILQVELRLISSGILQGKNKPSDNSKMSLEEGEVNVDQNYLKKRLHGGFDWL